MLALLQHRRPLQIKSGVAKRLVVGLYAASLLLGVPPRANSEPQEPGGHLIKADVVALDQGFYNNRLGTFQAGGMIFALRRDVVPNDGSGTLTPGNVMLRPDKRARPLVLRMNVGDCMRITFQNLLANVPSIAKGSGSPPIVPTNPYSPANAKTVPDPSESSQSQSATRLAGVHVMGMMLREIKADGSWVGVNDNSLSAPGDPAKTYEFCAEAEGAYLLYSTAADVGELGGFGGQLSQGLFGAVTVQPRRAEWYRSQVTREELELATYRGNKLPPNFSLSAELDGQHKQKTFDVDGKTYKVWQLKRKTPGGENTTTVTQTNLVGDPVDQDGLVKTRDLHPIVDYQAIYPPGSKYPSGTSIPDGTPVLAILDKDGYIVHSDLTAIITGPHAGLFPESNDPAFSKNPTYPDRQQPYREFAIHYHDDFVAIQAFPEFSSASFPVNYALQAARDFFAINYGMGGIGAEVWANRIKVGPMYQCDSCKFEEFFLSAWASGDPAMVVDFPANSTVSGTGSKSVKATKALYPDDPSNVYHSYLGDHVEFRILHAGSNITHVHHQHAHQWLHSPDSDESDYRDSQMISPGGSYSLDITYFGSGNLNQTVGDSIFHCHFYPHFAQGMWSLWRVHDVFEEGTQVDPDGRPLLGWNRALPDGEIKNGTPIPALVPLPEIPMAPMPGKEQICAVYGPTDYVQFSGEKCPDAPNPITPVVGYKALVSKVDLDKDKNPGYPFYIPGVAGQRAPHPPLDFAPDEDDHGKQKVDAHGKKLFLDGGLPRSEVLRETGTIYEHHNRWDFTKENDSLIAVELDEAGTSVEQKAMATHAVRKHASFTPEGNPGDFILNGQGPKPGAPFADPAVDIHGHAIAGSDCEKREPGCIRYKAADIETDVVLNKKGWHFPQQRMLSLWGDVKDNLNGTRRPEPLFFRANSKQVVEYWQANLVPANYELDDFQVRTPTDILGQHIHLVKFDVTSSDGAGNGFNYEDGTFSPEEVVSLITQINKTGGLFATDASHQIPLAPREIPYFAGVFPGKWPGAQATIQRWYADPVYDCKKPLVSGKAPLPCETDGDRTLRTVFTHDHFGPSTHQQVGLYAGLVVEPSGSKWFDSTTGEKLATRFDGGPTTYQANIIVRDPAKSYREFLLEFQDRQLAYENRSISKPVPYVRYTEPKTSPPGFWGWADPTNAINAPIGPDTNPGGPPTPHLITNQFGEGVYSLNYENEPLGYRLRPGAQAEQSDLAHVFRSITRADTALNIQPAANAPIAPSSAFKFPPPQVGAGPLDPYTPLLRTYQGDNVQVRNLVGAHMGPHAFHVHGLDWQFEPSFKDSGFRSTQGMSLSEHYEVLFRLPVEMRQADYLYIPSSDTVGLEYGNWGLLRAYKEMQPNLVPLSASQKEAFPDSGYLPVESAASVCPTGMPKDAYKTFDITAVFARDVLDGPLVYNARGLPGSLGQGQIVDWNALMYVLSADLVNGKLKQSVPREPLILRANAGDCITVHLTNALPQVPLNTGLPARDPVDNVTLNTSHEVGLHAQLVSYDVTESDGVNIGLNPVRSVKPTETGTFTWYAGRIDHTPTGKPIYTPVEFGAISLSPTDPLMQHNFGMVGALIIEPKDSAWTTDDNSRASATVTMAPGHSFREAVVVVHDDLASLRTTQSVQISGNLTNGNVQWALNGTLLSNGSKIPVRPGDTVAFYVNSGTHGITFLSKQDALAFLDFGKSAGAFKPQPSIGANAWGTDGQATAGSPVLLAVLTVKKNIPATLKELNFECTVHKEKMQGVLVLDGIFLAGAATDIGVQWIRNGVPLANNSVTPVKPGQTVTVAVESAKHGITFLDKSTAEAVFDFGAVGVPFQAQAGIGANAWGTPGETSGTLATLTVKSTIPSTITKVDFECTIHQQKMAGTFVIDRGASGRITPLPTNPAETDRAINYRTEPFEYRFLSPNYLDNTAANSPIGIARAVSDTLVADDPQTPVFVAEAGKPLRLRMLHPAGTNEQVFELHGHNWQEEPYTDDSKRIGTNPFSQWTGSRDSFGPNSSFDVVLSQAGGVFATKGDYLFRTFMGTDFLLGMWGVVRVGEPGQDVVSLTQFCTVAPASQLRIAGVNTVNPTNHHMAKTVTLSNGATQIGTADVDAMTGEWSFETAISPAPTAITAKSDQGGVASTSTLICPIEQNQLGRPVLLLAPLPALKDLQEIFRFKASPRVLGQPANQKPIAAKP
jgi:plastocyanin